MTQIMNGLGMIGRGAKSFYLFWKDFLVGDCPEIAAGVVVILGIAFAVRTSAVAAALIVPGAVVLLLAVSIWHGRGK